MKDLCQLAEALRLVRGFIDNLYIQEWGMDLCVIACRGAPRVNDAATHRTLWLLA